MKPGAGQGSPLRVAPPVQSDTTVIITSVWGGSPTSRSPYHQVCLLAARAGQPNASPMQYLGAELHDLGALGWRHRPCWSGLLGWRGSGWGFAAGAIAEGGGGDDGWLLRWRQG